MNKENDSKKVLLVFLFMLGLTVVIFGVSYAFFRYSKEGTKQVTISVGSVKLHYEENSLKKINLTEALPMDDERGKAQTDYFEFTITSETTSYEIPYYVASRITTNIENQIPSGFISLYLTEVISGEEQEVLLTTYDTLTAVSKNNHIEQQLMLNTVAANTSNYEKVYRLRMWINEDANYSPVEVNGVQVYPMQDKSFDFIINVYTEAEEIHECQVAFDVTGTLQNAGTLTQGDEVEIGTEHFYVVSSDEDTTVLLPKYNIVIYGYATPIGSVDDLQFSGLDNNGYRISGYNPNVPFSYQDYWVNTIDNSADHPIVYDSTKVTAPTFDDHTCIPMDQYKTYYHDTLGIPWDDEDNESYDTGRYDPDTYEYNSNLYLYYASHYDNLICLGGGSCGCAYYNDYANLGYNAGRNSLKNTDDNIDYSVAYYVNRYKNKLESLYSNIEITNARLLTYEEAEDILDNNISIFSENDYSSFWLANTSINSYGDNYDVYYMEQYGINSGNQDAGVRPVLEVPTCAINLD